ncbi:hypothetical protein NOC27_1764 [Nitrosococcus oceani AFC27]|nr:hypothetical protein NOC27_1764 [Nitrosococcus oceani AFC27]
MEWSWCIIFSLNIKNKMKGLDQIILAVFGLGMDIGIALGLLFFC